MHSPCGIRWGHDSDPGASISIRATHQLFIIFLAALAATSSAFLSTTGPLKAARQPVQPTYLHSSVFSIEFLPSFIELENVSLKYPVTLARKLFSSVPRRELAVNNVTLSLSSEIVLLQGASSSGKTALMKLIMGQKQPTTGSLSIGTTKSNTSTTMTTAAAAVPIYLADKPPFDNIRTVEQILQRTMAESWNDISTDILHQICQYIKLLDDDNDGILSQKPAQLSPSQNYRIRLAEACLKSIAGTTMIRNTIDNASEKCWIPAPILLLDEWMDFETRDSSEKVEQSLLNLVRETGAVVICATHKPNLWKGLTGLTAQTSQITMSGGKILTLQQHQRQ